MKGKLLGLISAGVLAFTSIFSMPISAASGDVYRVGNGQNQHKGNSEGYSYEIWLDNTGGSGSMTLGSGATFKAEWSASVNRGNFLARRGLSFGSTKKATDYEYIGMDYKANYQQTGSASGNSRLCVYGWFENQGAAGNPPLVEYYIIEDWVDWCPDGNGTMVTIDNAQYKIFQMDHTGPDIHGGNSTFKQYYSVRQSKRCEGHITVSEHFKAWAQQGWGIGNLYEVALNAEGWQSSGTADVTMLDVYTDPNHNPGDDPIVIETTTPKESDKNYFVNDFESGADNWTARGTSTKLTTDTENYYDGGKSIAVTGRQENWNGIEIPLSTSTYIPGQSYSFNAAVLQTSGETTEIKMTLQYNGGGQTQYDKIATVDAKSGEWTAIGNESYTIPTGATNLKLYIEAPNSKCDFYVDAASATDAGTKSTIITGGGTVKGQTVETTLPQETTIIPETTTTVSSFIITPGDVDENGSINVGDAVLLARLLGNDPDVSSEITTQGKLNAEVDGVSGLSSGDLIKLLRVIARLENF